MRARIWIYAASALLAVAAFGQDAPSGLTDDGRFGVVTDLQGTVLVQPAGRQRWSPVGRDTVLLPGDRVRTMPRGANAAEIRLADGGSLVVGAGALVRLTERGALHLVRGDAEVSGAGGVPVRVTGAGDFEQRITGTVVLRARDGATTALDETPRWLTGYRGSTTDEWLGSLVANVDGRDVPLSVGYHKVDVVIRDQIAVTTVEESFVNSTDAILEGVFSFPLPPDASISGFGMWIGGELVEADIVERQRARQIYEDIRARRKDPGLLEWSGGNVFKASVFPIPAHGEKRIRLRYTQVLPLEGARVRYRYALRSELLRTNPLRRLQIRVRHHSSAPIESASSPTHDVAVTHTTHDATLEYTAEDVVPDRDFEASFTLAARDPLRVVPHRRGEDGYFMLLLAPPDAAAGGWERELVPEGDPLDVLFVADTSGSTGPAERAAQRDFIASLLSLLGAQDRFRLMACDAVTTWIVEQPTAATDENVQAALTALDRRFSLGWTDLDKALREAAADASDGTLVVYVGDGIGTTGDADPVALAQRIRRMDAPAGAAFHAVATGSSFESGVLDAIASLGDGSARRMDGEPARAATALLTEVAQPPVKGLEVSFEGLRTARVYPERLPSLPAGTQQIVLGRFLPTGDGPQRGKVTVAGTRDGAPVRFSADLVVAESEEGNSFLPRLWARRHLDALLAEGRTPAIRDEIVSFSERFGIMTPYTSLLVLESDADRERYGVTRRVHMRDGERFFTEGRTAADLAALREEVAKARSWRLALRRRMLAEISDLGRSLYTRGYGYAWGGGGGGGGGMRQQNATIGIGGGAERGFYRGPGGELAMKEAEPVLKDAKKGDHNETDNDFEGFDEVPPDSREPFDPPPPARSMDRLAASGPSTGGGDAGGPVFRSDAPFEGPAAFGRRAREIGGGKRMAAGRRYTPWLGTLLFQRFPPVPPPAERPAATVEPEWPDDVRAVLASVSAPPALSEDANAAVEVRMTGMSPRTGALAGLADQIARGIVAHDRWLVRRSQLGQESAEHWAVEHRGALHVGQRLGRRRPATEEDRDDWAGYVGLHRTDWVRTHATWAAVIESRDGALVTVLLTPPEDSRQGHAQRVVVDTEKAVVVRQETLNDGEVTWTQAFAGFVEAAGRWWPTEQTSAGADGKVTWRVRWLVNELQPDGFARRLERALSAHSDVIFLPPANPPLDEAKQRVHEGDGDFADHMVIASDHAGYQRWDDAWESWEAANAALDDKPGTDWIDLSLLTQSRQGEPLVAHVDRMSAALAERVDDEARPLASMLLQQGTPFHVNERLSILDVLERAGIDDDIGPEDAWWDAHWRRQRAGLLQSIRRFDEAIALWRALHDSDLGTPQDTLSLLNTLAQAGRVDPALELLDALDTSGPGWNEHQVRQVYRQLAQVTWNAMRFDVVLRLAERWAAATPADPTAHHAWLSALEALGRIEDVDAWVQARLESAAGVGEDSDARARLSAAVASALGSEWDGRWYGGPLDPRWDEELIRVARALATDPKGDGSIVNRIVHRRRYGHSSESFQSDVLDALRAELAAPGVVESLPPQRLSQFLAWLPWDRTSVETVTWRGITDRVIARWRATEDEGERRVLFHVALGLLDRHLEPAEAADLLRAALATAPDAEIPGHANLLLQRLAQLPWTQAIEEEMLALVPRNVPAEAETPQRTQTFAPMVRWLTDRLYRMRVEAALGPPEEREKLTRAELRARQTEARSAARLALAERYRQESSAAENALRPWYEIERICFLAEAGDDLAAIEGEAREMLLSIASGDDADDGWRWLLRERSVLALSYLTLRRGASEELADRGVALLHERLAAEPDALDWRYAIFRLLVALDRPEPLEAALREWIVPAHVESRWRIALGYLAAELGRLDEATALFEKVAELDELDESGYVSLSDWYLVLGDDTRRESALERRYRVVDEWALAQQVSQERYRLQSRDGSGVPPDMDDEVLRKLRVLLSKSSQPQGRVYEVTALYRFTKDFRVLAALADGVIGHTPQAVYPYLRQTSGILQQVHEEATCDEVRARLETRLPDAKTDTDRRALRLLMSQVERRAAEVLDQPGPHVERALAHLREARKGDWLPGERRLMAEYLESLGKIPHRSLADEQLDQLRALHAGAERGTEDRLRIAKSLHATEWVYDSHDAAIDGLVAALDEHREAHGGALPDTVNDVVDLVTRWHEARKRFGAGEALLLAERERQPGRAQKEWYERRIFTLYVACLQHGGTVSLGSGGELYRAAREQMERALAEHAPDALEQVLRSYLELHVHRKGQEPASGGTAVTDLVAFSRTLLPEVQPRFGNRQMQQVRAVGETLRKIGGALRGLTFLVERLEAEPAWFRRRGLDGWASFGGHVAQWRHDAGARLGPLEPRLLAVVLNELRMDLVTQQQRNRSIYHRGRYIWKAKEPDFLRVTREVIAEHPEHATVLHHAARYLWEGLHAHDEAISTLLDADARGALEEPGRWSLVGWLTHEKRWSDALPHAQRLVADQPDQLHYRVAAIRVLHALARDDEGRALVDASATHFEALEEAGQRNTRFRETLGQICLECEYHERAVTLLERAIRDHERATRGRIADGDHRLSGLYGSMARALMALERFDEAVDASSAAVVSMGPSQRNRRGALSALQAVLAAIPDLPAWTARYEEEAAETGLDAPVIRRALAGIHVGRREPEPALRHLRAALRHTPDDAELHGQVIAACRMTQDDDAVAAAIADALAHVPAQPQLYAELGALLQRMERPVEAERALTGLAEYAPNEPQGHRALAQALAQAERLEEAVVQWQQVVRTNEREVAGWLELARAQMRVGDTGAARETLDALLATEWGAAAREAIEKVSQEIRHSER